VQTAAKGIATKQASRDALAFTADPLWKYKQNLKTADTALQTAWDTYHTALKTPAPVVAQPAFAFTPKDDAAKCPAPPAFAAFVPNGDLSEAEQLDAVKKFCKSNNCDAFFVAQLTLFHDRYVLDSKIYTIYAAEPVWTNQVIFSLEDMEKALASFLLSLDQEASGAKDAVLSIKASPDTAAIHTNASYAGQGTAVINQSPGDLTVNVQAEGYETQSAELTLQAGTHTSAVFDLKPIPVYTLPVATAGGQSARVWEASNYLGTTPIDLKLPATGPVLLNLEDDAGKTASVVVSPPKQPAANAVPEGLTIALNEPLSGKTVEDYRKSAYNAYGALWIALPVTMVFTSVANLVWLNVSSQGTAISSDRAKTLGTRWYTYLGVSIVMWAVTAGIGVDWGWQSYNYIKRAGRKMPKS
jgi:hypothetical protein